MRKNTKSLLPPTREHDFDTPYPQDPTHAKSFKNQKKITQKPHNSSQEGRQMDVEKGCLGPRSPCRWYTKPEASGSQDLGYIETQPELGSM